MALNNKRDKKTIFIQFKIDSIKKISFYEKDFKEYNLTSSDVSKGTVKLAVSVNINISNGIISFTINADFHPKPPHDNFSLFGIESLFSFKVKDFKNVFDQKDKDKFKIPDSFMNEILNIAISGTRGMLAALISNPSYSKVILPIIDTKQILSSLKAENLLVP